MKVRDFLDRDEDLLWTGAPARGLMLRAADILLVPFSLLWGGLALFWTLGVTLTAIERSGSGGIDPQFIPFLIVGFVFSAFGLFLIIGRFVVDMTRRSSTEYAITTKRAIILSGFFGRSLDSMPLNGSVQIKVSGHRRGSIRFGAGFNGFDFSRALRLWLGPSHPFMFERIRDPRRVYGIVRGVQERRG